MPPRPPGRATPFCARAEAASRRPLRRSGAEPEGVAGRDLHQQLLEPKARGAKPIMRQIQRPRFSETVHVPSRRAEEVASEAVGAAPVRAQQQSELPRTGEGAELVQRARGVDGLS